MSSPPTSVKAATLCTSRPNIRARIFSYLSIATLNLFRKKLPPQPFSPVEPYEIAPDIWSTAATARVFGYFDTNDKSAELGVQRAEPSIQARSQKAKHKETRIEDAPGRCKQAHFVGSTEQCSTDNIRDGLEAPSQLRQKGRDEEGAKKGSNWYAIRQRTMRTVSRDDQLVERGANPRTGLVSPFVVSDNGEECLEGGYIAVAKVGSAGPLPGQRTCSGKWKQDSLGWSLIESPLLSPTAQSMSDKMSQTISAKQLEDRLLVDMPSADDLDPERMIDEQINQYQNGIARAYKSEGWSAAVLDPDTIPSPRQWTPVRPSTPPTKLRKIRRKEVRSGVVCKSTSSDTVIVNASNRELPPRKPRKDIMEQQKNRIFTPSNTLKQSSSFESCAEISNKICKAVPFLNQESRNTCSQIVSATQSQSYPNTRQTHHNHQTVSESNQSSMLSDPPVASQSLSQYLPPLQLLHPSHFANLETSPRRHLAQLRPRLLRRQRRPVEDACTTVFTTASTKGQGWEQRPKMRMQDENDVALRVNHLSPEHEQTQDGSHQATTPRKKRSSPRNLPVDTIHTLGLVLGRNHAIGSTKDIDPVGNLVDTRCQRKTQTRADCLRQPPYENLPRCLARPRHPNQSPSRESNNVTQEPFLQNQSGRGSTPTFDHHGYQSTGLPFGRLQPTSDNMEHTNLSAEITDGSDSRFWFSGQRVEVEEKHRRPDLSALMLEKTLMQRRSALRKAADVNSWLYYNEALAERLATRSPIQQLFYQMICHVIRTLNQAPLALTTLRMANATTHDRLGAMKDLVLTAVYLLVLLHSLIVLRGVLVRVSKVLYWAWHSVQTVLRIVGWVVVG